MSETDHKDVVVALALYPNASRESHALGEVLAEVECEEADKARLVERMSAFQRAFIADVLWLVVGSLCPPCVEKVGRAMDVAEAGAIKKAEGSRA